MANTILTEFQQTQKLFLQALSSFTEDQFNVVPFEGSWTAAQVVSMLQNHNPWQQI